MNNREELFKQIVIDMAKEYDVIGVDEEEKQVIFAIGEDFKFNAFLDEKLNVELEIGFRYSSNLLSLHTMSFIADIAFSYKCGVTGARNYSNGVVKTNVIRQFKYIDFENLASNIDIIYTVSKYIDKYIKIRGGQTELNFLDISMFEDVDFEVVDPHMLGEQKQFSFGNWDSFYNAIEKDNDLTGEHKDAMLIGIEACKKFEEENSLLLSEVGEIVLYEIMYHSSIEPAGDFDVN